MHSLRTQLTALLLMVAFVLGFVHCSLHAGCPDETSTPTQCQTCVCHIPAVSKVEATVLTPAIRFVEPIIESFEPNARLAAVSIFNPPKA